NMARRLQGKDTIILHQETMIGALARYISDETVENFQPMGANMGILPEIGVRIKDKQERYQVIADRALEAFEKYMNGTQT
ncbi:MAG: methylenetetrahydrofolate--tRNA-(uracil(54)-C(5))-methyltransferase (FADH(2)-oxidizing) TrmFO, partial [Oscillospiraceae bacterium]|nr:methylenetetrahydrofolate--tRNA-(uracil(54)-C(5))-methyltransferase (FADH(2)-oxidizing) TrmFO [Oscillospiraceae bacterium]